MDVKVRGRLGCSYQEIVEFGILRGGNRTKTRNAAWNFRKADFNFFRALLGITSHGIHPWRERNPGERALQAQERPILTSSISSKGGRCS